MTSSSKPTFHKHYTQPFFLGEKNGWNYKGWKSVPTQFCAVFIDLLQDFCSLKSGSTWLKFCQISYDSLCMRHSKNPIHSQVFVKILLKAPLISKVNYDNALFIITKLTTYRSSAFSAAGQEDMRSIVQFLLRDGASGVAVENCLIEQWTLVCRGAELW